MIRRGFVDLPDRQVHYRSAGSGPPILLLHASPGSSKQLEGLIAGLAAAGRRVIAPDMPGNGDSPALAGSPPEMPDLAGALLEVLAALEIDRADIYGSHTGAALAAELAIAAPHGVDHIVLDGIGAWSETEAASLLERYAHPFEPDLDGAHLLRAFTFCRDQTFFFPWYARDRQHRRDVGLSSARSLHDWVVEVLKAATTYQHNYHAAFRWRAAERLALVAAPVLAIASATDPLLDMTRRAASHLPNGRFSAMPRGDEADYAARLVHTILDFTA